MSGRYAEGTPVAVSASRDEIERTLRRFGATAFAYYAESNEGREWVAIMFEINRLRVKMTMTLPDREQFAEHSRGRRDPQVIESMWEKECRRYWRTLANGIKAKLALVEDGISSVEREFFPDILLPNGGTVYETVMPEVQQAIAAGKMPPMIAIQAKVL